VLATTGNLNNHIGVPLTLLARKASHKVAVIEMGMNHFDEIALLTQLTEPTIAVITNAAPAHLEGVGSLAGVAEAKGEIFAGLRAGGVAVLNADDYFLPYWQVLNRERAITTFGFATAANVRGKSGASSGQMLLNSSDSSSTVEIQLPVEGEHNVSNALAAAAVARTLGIRDSTIKRGLEATVNVSGRLTSRPFINGTTLIDDSYNANPASMRAAAQVLMSHAPPRILVVGDMGELGELSEKLHEELVRDIQQFDFDDVFTLGRLMKQAAGTVGVAGQSFEDVESLADSLFPSLTAGATLLVKGSRSMATERVIKKLEQMARGTH
jgi:UDP-N-acetylmuramoyl-tripeptide--D-alanyl-D-alanine ligase